MLHLNREQVCLINAKISNDDEFSLLFKLFEVLMSLHSLEHRETLENALWTKTFGKAFIIQLQTHLYFIHQAEQEIEVQNLIFLIYSVTICISLDSVLPDHLFDHLVCLDDLQTLLTEHLSVLACYLAYPFFFGSCSLFLGLTWGNDAL